MATSTGAHLLGPSGSGSGTTPADTTDEELADSVWSLVQDSCEFRADTIETNLTHAERAAIGPAWPDGPIGFCEVSGTMYAFASDGATNPEQTRTTYDPATATFSDPATCTMDYGTSGVDYLAAGPVFHDGSRYLGFAHGETLTVLSGHLITSVNGVDWEWVSELMGSDLEVVTVFEHPTDGYFYCYCNDGPAATTYDTFLARVDVTDLFVEAAGGAAATFEVWDGDSWSTTITDAIPVAGINLPTDLKPISSCQYVSEIGKVLAIGHDETGVVGYQLYGYVIDPDTPWLATNNHYLYRDTSDEFVDPGSNIGYVSLTPVHDDLLNVFRVDALDPGPNQPWDDTIVTRVELRPVVANERPTNYEVDAVCTAAAPTGTSVNLLPDQSAATLSNNQHVVFYDQSTTTWRRMIVKSSGDWIDDPRGLEEGDTPWYMFEHPDGITRPIEFTVGDVSYDEGVVMTNIAWSGVISQINTSVFIYNSSGGQSGKRYDDWDTLMQIVALNEGPKIILFEQDEVITPTNLSFSLSGVELRGDGATGQGQLKVRFGDATTTDQIDITNWAGGSITETLVVQNACPAPIFDSSAGPPRIRSGAALHGIQAPVMRLTGTFDAVILDGGVLTRNPTYPINVNLISSASWDAGSGGLLTLNFGSPHGLSQQYVGSEFTIRDADPTTYNTTRIIDSIPDADTVVLVEASDPGALVSVPADGNWTAGVSAVDFNDTGTFHILAFEGDRPNVELDSVQLGSAALLLTVVSSASAIRTDFTAPGQVDLLGTVFAPEAADQAYAIASNIFNNPAALINLVGNYVSEQIAELDALVDVYTPAVPGDWTTPPTTVSGALDAIAAGLGPIP